MKTENIEALKGALPDAFNQRVLPKNWDEDFAVLPVDEFHEPGSFEDSLFSDERDENLFNDPGQINKILREVFESDVMPDGDYGEVSEISKTLGQIFDTDFPGSPANSSTTPAPVATDTLGFYLPWHEFDTDHWGIYVIAEGVNALGNNIRNLSHNYLTLSESRRVAKGFIFHHEAFHNIVETFAAQSEISYRKICYIGGFRDQFKWGPTSGLIHEEGLANAYSFSKISANAFANVPNKAIRRAKRKLAQYALRKIIGSSPHPYNTALSIERKHRFIEARNAFQEDAIRRSMPTLPHLSPDSWEAAMYSMSPSLHRNGHFSYIVSRNSTLGRRLKLSVFYLKRTAFLKQLEKVVGGSEVIKKSGRHPRKWVTKTGQTIPLTFHGKDIDKRLAGGILKQLGVADNIDNFMNL